jgi:uncharacterized protein YndB with AHSA1/START domain
MLPVDVTERSQTETLAFQIDLPHRPEKVWRALTEPALLSEWLLPVLGIDLAPGATFTLQAPAFPGWDGKVHCRFLEIEAPRKLSYRWVVGEMELDTIVTFTLASSPVGTQLLITQSGFQPHQKKNFGGARYGWKMMGEKLVALLATIT